MRLRKRHYLRDSLRAVASVAALGAVLAAATHAFALASLPADNPKYLRVRSIYDKVARAYGDGRVPPRLVVSPLGSESRNAVAWSDPGTEGSIGIETDSAPLQEGYIAIDERVYDLFASLKEERDDALAFLLGHELIHYYLRHGWVGDFGNSFAGLDVGRRMIRAASYEETIKRETEADYFGGFYGYLAGYDTLSVASRALDLIYAEYRLPDRLPNYPSRQERKAIAERAEGNLKKMVPLFDAAKNLLLLEKYRESARLFQHLAHSFPSREMFNNAGVAYALEALRLFTPGKEPLVYPFELDAETRLKGRGGRVKGAPDQFAGERRRLLNLAADNFDKAVQRDRGYPAACINLAAATSLLGDHDSAVILANKGMELARRGNETITLANALVVRGIAYAGAGNRERALVDFAAARNLNSPAAALNMAILQKEPAPGGEPGGEAAPGERETIGGISSRDNFVTGKDVNVFSLHGVDSGEPAITLYARESGSWEDALIVVGGKLNRVISTGKGYAGRTSRGIAIGSNVAELRGKYGPPSRIVTAPGALYYLYRKAELLFQVDQDERVGGWSLFSVQ